MGMMTDKEYRDLFKRDRIPAFECGQCPYRRDSGYCVKHKIVRGGHEPACRDFR